jgi:Uma2 family endonuclease
MARKSSTLPASWTVADFLEHYKEVPVNRIRLHPAPGTATEDDLRRILEKEDRLYELVDGVLVEKTMGTRESALAMWLGHLIFDFLSENDLGFVTGPDGTFRLMPRLVRIPDVAFVSWKHLPGRTYPEEPIPDLVPDLAIEVLSKYNTKEEMERKLKEYFLAGVELVWFVDPVKRRVRVFTSPDESRVLAEGDELDGGDVLPGFKLPLRKLFARVKPARGSKGKKNGRKR